MNIKNMIKKEYTKRDLKWLKNIKPKYNVILLDDFYDEFINLNLKKFETYLIIFDLKKFYSFYNYNKDFFKKINFKIIHLEEKPKDLEVEKMFRKNFAIIKAFEFIKEPFYFYSKNYNMKYTNNFIKKEYNLEDIKEYEYNIIFEEYIKFIINKLLWTKIDIMIFLPYYIRYELKLFIKL